MLSRCEKFTLSSSLEGLKFEKAEIQASMEQMAGNMQFLYTTLLHLNQKKYHLIFYMCL